MSCSRPSRRRSSSALIAGAFALVQRGRARHTATVAQAGRLAAQSREVAAKHPDLALLLALEAGRLDDSVDSRGALLGALEHGSRIRAWLQGFDSPVNADGVQPRRQAPGDRDARRDHALGHGDLAARRRRRCDRRRAAGTGVDFSPDGRTLAIAGGKGRVELWDVATRKKLRELTDPAAATSGEPALAVVRYSPDGSVIAAGGAGGEPRHAVGRRERPGDRPADHRQPAGIGGAQSISFSPDSKRIAVPGARGTVGIWEVATGRRVGEPLAIGSEDVEEAIFAADGRTLIASDDSGSVSMVDVANGTTDPPAALGRRRRLPARWISARTDGCWPRLRSTGPVFVWDAKTGAPYGSPLTADTSPVNDVAFSPDGRTLVSSHLRSAVVWNMNGEQAIGRAARRAGPI